METFEWKDIPGYEGLYQVSRCGLIKRLQVGNRNERILNLNSYNNYYIIAGLRKGDKSRNHPVHRLVAMAFIPNPGNKPFVNHKDLDKTNNHADNLEWCTQKENSQHWADCVRARQEAFVVGKKVVVNKTDHEATVINREGRFVFINPTEKDNILGYYHFEELEIIS